MPRLLIYISHLNYGGAEQSLLKLLPELSQYATIDLVTDLKHSSLAKQFNLLENKKLHFIHLSHSSQSFVKSSGHLLSIICFFLRVSLRGRYDYFLPLLLNNSFPLILFRIFSPRTRAFIWEHTIISRHYPKRYKWFYNLLIAHGIFLPSTKSRDDLLNLFPSLKSRAHLLPNPCNLSSFPMHLQYDNLHIVTLVVIGRLSSEKQFDKSIHVLDLLLRRGYNINLHIYGEGPEFHQLTRLVVQFSLADYVTFYKFCSNPWASVPANSLVLVLSKYESFSMVTLEALCLGLPVIVTPDSNSHLFDNHPLLSQAASTSICDIVLAAESIFNHRTIEYVPHCDDILYQHYSPSLIAKMLFSHLSFSL